MTYILGIDPGQKGALSLISDSRSIISITDMPCDYGNKQTGYLNPVELLALLRRINRLPDVIVALEWPTSRPGEGGERSNNFGKGLGYLEMALLSLFMQYVKIPPANWKKALGLPGKTNPNALKLTEDMFNQLFPKQSWRITGPRGGFKDGRADATLIAEYMRRRLAEGTPIIPAK